MTAYATVPELTAWLPTTVEGVADPSRLLDRASELIDEKVRTPFSVDDDGIPTDPDLAAVLRDACCAQVEFWVEVGEEHDIAGMGGRQASILGLSMQALPPELGPRCTRLLRTAGLLGPVLTGASTGTWWQQ